MRHHSLPSHEKKEKWKQKDTDPKTDADSNITDYRQFGLMKVAVIHALNTWTRVEYNNSLHNYKHVLQPLQIDTRHKSNIEENKTEVPKGMIEL